MLIALNAPLE